MNYDDLIDAATIAAARADMTPVERGTFDLVTDRPAGFNNPMTQRILDDARPIARAVLDTVIPEIERRAKIALLDRMQLVNNDKLPASVIIGVELKHLKHEVGK